MAMKHEDKIKIITPDWVGDCMNKGSKQDETLYHPRLVVYPKPPSPPKPESPPKVEPMEVSVQTARVSKNIYVLFLGLQSIYKVAYTCVEWL